MLKAPWTKAQIEALNRWQRAGFFDPFTCPSEHALCRVLVATEAGWVCPCCDYTQDWAHEFMLESPPAWFGEPWEDWPTAERPFQNR